MNMKNKGGFLIEEVDLLEVAQYIRKLPAYKSIVRKIETVRKRIKSCINKNKKDQLRSLLGQLIEKKKDIVSSAFYTKYPTQTKITTTAINAARKLKRKNPWLKR